MSTQKVFLTLLCILISPAVLDGYKILVFNPKLGGSHVNFMGRLADTLANAGHDVVVYQPVLNENVTSTGSKAKNVRVVTLPKNESLYVGFSMTGHQQDLFDNKFDNMNDVTKHRTRFCEEILKDHKNHDLLKAENFDLGITEHFEVCGYGVFKLLNISKYVTSTSTALLPHFTQMLGVKPHFSYTVGLTAKYSDKMNFFQRLRRVYDHFMERYFVSNFMEKNGVVPIQKMYPDFDPGLAFARAAYVFANSDEYLDYVQPITPKIVYIANLGNGAGKPLPDEYEAIVSKAKKGIVLFSFGSVLHSNIMPEHIKSAFLDAFAEFPDVTFLWKYESPEDGYTKHVPNVIARKWLPQRDLLHHPRLLAFITHGGQNSFNEAIAAGVPMLCMPVFADQPKNAHHIASKELGLELQHKDLTKDKVVAALRETLGNDKYRNNAQLVSNIIKKRNKWQTPEDRFIKNVEMAAEFGDTGTLSAMGAEQSAIVFYSLDVMGFVVTVLMVLILLIKKLVGFVVKMGSSLFVKAKSE